LAELIHCKGAISVKKSSIKSALRSAACLSAIAFFGTTGAYAQEAPASTQQGLSVDSGTIDGETIVVTGSRISRPESQTASPIEIVTAESLDARGFQTVAQALNQLPSFGIPGASPVGFDQSTFGAGQSFVNFLGLGSQRTLVLVNGRRFVSSNTGTVFGPTGSGGTQVDLNTIPTKLIERVETVAAIGAPIYGSDAVAGTVNIILKRNYDGLDIDAQNGISSRGDARDQRIRLVAGKNFAGGRGNLTIAGEYNKSKGLLYTDRSITSVDDRFDLAASGSGPQPIYRDLRIPSIDPSGVPLVTDFALLSPQQSTALFGVPFFNVGVQNGSGQTLRFGPDGSLVPVDFGGTVGATDGFSSFTSGGNGYSLRSVENLLTDLERYSINANLSYQLTDDIRFFAEGWYSLSKGRNLADQPVYNSAFFGAAGDPEGNLVISLNNPFLSATARTAIQNALATNPFSDGNSFGFDQDYFYLARANTDLQTGVSTGKSRILRFVGGFDGTLNVLSGREWKFEAWFNYGQARVSSRTPQLNQQNFLNAIDAVVVGNQIVCRPGHVNSPVATLSSACAPLNPFGQQISQAARDYVTTIATPRTLNNQYDGVVSVSGPLLALPGGDLSFALGYEHRAESSNFDPGEFFYGSGTGSSAQRGSYGRSVPIDPVSGKYHTDELFGELSANLVSPSNGIPLIHELTLQTAGRYIWNSRFGSDPTYTFQARWAPVRDIALRAAYTRAVRAPSITEAFNPTATARGFAEDVCDQSLVNQGPNAATRAANCAAAGVPANFNATSDDASINTYTFGNAGLRNERSDSWTWGLVLSPGTLPGLNATVDYVSITLDNAISEYSNDDVVKACYDSSDYPNNPFCALITRNGNTGNPTTAWQIDTVGTTYFNSARLKYRGVIANVDYRRPTPFLGSGSSIGINLSLQRLITLTNQATPGSAPEQLHNSIGYSRNKGILTLDYTSPTFSGQVQINHIGSARIDPDKSPDFYSVPKIGSFTYVNVAGVVRVDERFDFRISVDNLFDKKPPYPYPASGGGVTYFQGILGTYVRVGAGVHF